MRLSSLSRRRLTVGISLDTDRLVAFLPGAHGGRAGASRPRLWVRALAASSENLGWTDLATALAELMIVAGTKRGRLYVALEPPLGLVRSVDLRGVSEEEARHIVRRDPSRFFPSRQATLAVELRRPPWSRGQFLAVAAAESLVESIGEAARTTGWSLGGVVPAQLAWAAALGNERPLGEQEIVVRVADHVEVIGIRAGMIRTIRRVAIEETEDDAAPAIRARLAQLGIALTSDARVLASPSEARALAATFASRTPGPSLFPEVERAAAKRSRRRGMVARFTAAAGFLVVAAKLELSGLERERAHIAAERARLRPVVEQSIALRESLAVSTAQLAALRGDALAASHWSSLIVALADTLPDDAFLVALSGDRDSIHIEGRAAHAAPVFDALASMTLLTDVRADGPIRQDVHDDATSEHFTLVARLTRSESLPPSRSAASGNPRLGEEGKP